MNFFCKKTLFFIIYNVLIIALASGSAFAMGSMPPEPNFDNEPAMNTFLADSPWPATHRNSYCQASSPYPGPMETGCSASTDFNIGATGLITIAISGEYPNGKRVVWGSSSTSVFKATPSLQYIDVINKEDLTLGSMFSTDEILSGAYTILDKDNIFYMPRFKKILAFGDKSPGVPDAEIEIKREYEIPEAVLTGPDEKIVGLTMTYDGMLAFATSQGLVGVLSRDFETAFYLSLGPETEVSNSIACDEDGGIYVVTSLQMHRVQWTGNELTIDEAKGGWSADYEIGDVGGVRLGAGSGATPTLMGTGDQDKFVVITDAQELMHLVLFWRDEIPADWQQIPGTKDRRIAAQVPVTFGDPDATDTLSEQSVCVRGYGALVVNNQLKLPLNNQAIAILASGVTPVAPYGAEKFEWDPATRTLSSAWVNSDVSMPNGIPCMSAASNMVYDVGQNWLGAWTFEALDWDTGESVFSYQYGITPIFNSAYAGTEIGLDSSLYSGTLFGMVRMTP